MRTTDKDQATIRSAELTAHFQRLFIRLKQDGAHMTPAEIEALVTRWMDTELQKTEDIRARYHFDDEQSGLMMDLAIDKYDDFRLFPAKSAARWAIPEADALLQDAGLPPMDHDS